MEPYVRQTLDKIKQTCYRTLGYNAKTIDGLKLKCDPDHVRLWRRMKKGRWEPQTLRILSEYLTPGSVFYDIGAWIGPTTLYAAPRCRHVYCFEPDLVAYQYLLWNLRLNRPANVTPFNVALHTENGISAMSSFGGEAGDSQSSLLNPADSNGMQVLCLTLETWIDIVKPEKPSFIKMDIEGAEFELLPAIADFLDIHKPILYLSTHGHLMKDNEKQEKMKALSKIVSRYATCLDENLKPVAADEWTSPRSLQYSRSFLLHD